MRLKIFLAALMIVVSVPAFAQVAPAATSQGSLPLSVGGGFTSTELDWGHGRRMLGPTIWLDWNLSHLPSYLNGLGVELQARDIQFSRPSSLPRMRQDTFGGGAIYTVRRYKRIRPYGKLLLSYGSIDFYNPNPFYKHDTRTVYSAGGGLEYHLAGRLWLRGDYDYQFWPHFLGGTLDPQGITGGVSYKFGHQAPRL